MVERVKVSGVEVIEVKETVIQGSKAEALRLAIDGAMKDLAGPLVLDMRGTTFLSSGGIGVIAGLIQRSKNEGRTFFLVTARDELRRLFVITRFVDFQHFRLVPNLDEALAAFRPRR